MNIDTLWGMFRRNVIEYRHFNLTFEMVRHQQ